MLTSRPAPGFAAEHVDVLVLLPLLVVASPLLRFSYCRPNSADRPSEPPLSPDQHRRFLPFGQSQSLEMNPSGHGEVLAVFGLKLNFKNYLKLLEIKF
jgi:hypothetical protein